MPGGVEVRVRFQPSGREARVPQGTTLLEAARRVGLPVASACGDEGLCARCGLQILEGGEDLPPASPEEQEAKTRNRIDSELRLSCRLTLDRDLVVTAPYW
jgi:ferredoxin